MNIVCIDMNHAPDSMLMQIQKNCAAFEFHKISGYEPALKYLELNVPDIIILDMRLPENGALAFLRQLHLNKITSPIIVLHNSIDLLTRQQSIIYGATHFVNSSTELYEVASILNTLSIK